MFQLSVSDLEGPELSFLKSWSEQQELVYAAHCTSIQGLVVWTIRLCLRYLIIRG